LISEVGPSELKHSIESQHGGTATFAQSVPVKRTHAGAVVCVAGTIAAICALVGTSVRADPVVAPDGTDAFFMLGWSAAADKRCGLKTYRIVSQLAKSRGLTDIEVAQNVPKIVDAIAQADDEIAAAGKDKWCANYRKGLLTGQ
jgi:hypothetical protein